MSRFAPEATEVRLTGMGWTGRAPAPNDSGRGFEARGVHHYVKAEERHSGPYHWDRYR